jgi:predicted nucleic acid-binding protein
LVRFARREFEAIVSEEILREFAETAWELKIEEGLEQNPQPWLNWFSARATMMAPSPLNAPVSSDMKTTSSSTVRLPAEPNTLLTRDGHLLRLEKPFGIRIVEDREFLTVLSRNDSVEKVSTIWRACVYAKNSGSYASTGGAPNGAPEH